MKSLLSSLIILLATGAASAQLTDTFTDGATERDWHSGPTSPMPLSMALGEPAEPTGDFLFPQTLKAEDLPARETGTASPSLDEVNPLRLLYDPAPTFSGSGTVAPPDAATLGLENSKAFYNEPPAWLSVPEPATYLRSLELSGLVALGLCGLLALAYLLRSMRAAGG